MTSMDAARRERLRHLPGVDAVLGGLDDLHETVAPVIAAAAVRRELADLRATLLGDNGLRVEVESLSAAAVADRVRTRLDAVVRPRPETVINATGVLVHTNLGRSPLSAPAIEHLSRVASGYSDLEFDLASGGRGSRHDHLVDLLQLLTGAEDALVVNNNAAAVLLSLAALATGREVAISRGELVEIGGSFRVPEILEQSGARLREVGTTNRTHRRDYEAALGEETGLLLQVHTSNYRIEGFTHAVPLAELVEIGAAGGVPVMVDLGSGALLDVTDAGVRPEPQVSEVVAAGPDVITLSGDKLLGGPQAGIILGKSEAIARIRRHPLARAVRVDKLLLAALHATLVAYTRPERAREEIPILRMVFASAEEIRERADRLAEALRAALPEPAPQVIVEHAVSAVGGGTLPLEGLTSSVVVLDPAPHTTAARFERALRHVRPAVLGRIRDDRILLDPRTLAVEQEGLLPGLVSEAWSTVIPRGA